jgi:CubicO group peptidase (beta-lactamase class C family)
MNFSAFLKREICDPLGISGMYIGIPENITEGASIAVLYEPGFDAANMNAGGIVTFPECTFPLCGWLNKKETLQACLPGVNGTMNALSLARHYAALLPCGIDGVKLVSDETIKAMTAVSSTDIQPEKTSYFGLGYALGAEGSVYGSRRTMFGHGGYGGTVAFGDLEHDFAMAVTKNFFHNDSAETDIIRKVQSLLGISPN